MGTSVSRKRLSRPAVVPRPIGASPQRSTKETLFLQGFDLSLPSRLPVAATRVHGPSTQHDSDSPYRAPLEGQSSDDKRDTWDDFTDPQILRYKNPILDQRISILVSFGGNFRTCAATMRTTLCLALLLYPGAFGLGVYLMNSASLRV